MSRRYAVIYADPPWRYSSTHHGYGGAEDHYRTMALEDIKAITVPAADDCALFLWATAPFLRQAFEVIDAWGFTYKTVGFVWIKHNPSGHGLASGLGYWTRANAEVCLLATRGRPRPVSHRVHSVVISPRRRHSQKPDEVSQRIVDLMGNVLRLEMFARTRTPGWDVWGNEVAGSIALESPSRASITRLRACRRNPIYPEERRIRCAG
jgi:site-specific DNA-methyltransferase (adenine-specific)